MENIKHSQIKHLEIRMSETGMWLIALASAEENISEVCEYEMQGEIKYREKNKEENEQSIHELWNKGPNIQSPK